MRAFAKLDASERLRRIARNALVEKSVSRLTDSSMALRAKTVVWTSRANAAYFDNKCGIELKKDVKLTKFRLQKRDLVLQFLA
jgi:hypothetical protein